MRNRRRNRALVDQLISAHAALTVGRREDKGVVSTGFSVLDWPVLRYGGFPLGRTVMLYGAEGGGKTTSALAACAQFQRAGGVAVYYDLEGKLDFFWAEKLGVDCDELVASSAVTIEELRDSLKKTLNLKRELFPGAETPMVVVLDSISSLESELGLSGKNVGMERAQVLSAMLRAVNPLVISEHVTLILVAQHTTRIAGHMSFYDSTGGNAPKFYSLARLQFRKATHEAKYKKGQTLLAVSVKKNQTGGMVGEFKLRVDRDGIDVGFDVLEAAAAFGLCQRTIDDKKRGSGYKFKKRAFEKITGLAGHPLAGKVVYSNDFREAEKNRVGMQKILKRCAKRWEHI